MLRNKNKYFSTELFVVTDFLIRKMSTMPLDLKGKIALVTGGASGIGLACVKALLRNGVKAVTLADINTNSVEIVLADIEKEFGADRVLFVKTDVTNSQQFENAFKKTIEKFKQLDILVNNAGIYNEQEWEKEVAINVALKIIYQKNRQGPEAVIVNLASIAAIDRFPNGPIYCATKAAVATLTRNFGDISYYERTKVRLLAVCPGVTMTPLVVDPALARKLYPVQDLEGIHQCFVSTASDKMVLNLEGKIALVTGGASGIGLRYAKELLRNGVKAVTLADVSDSFAQVALSEIEEEFGPNRALFVKTDVTDIQQFENAFKKTIEKFKHVDILINNAGILNDKIWEKEIAININGVIHGILLGLENYLFKYKQGPEAVIVNISSIAGLGVFPFIPIYCGTKAAVAALTRNWGTSNHYERTKVRVFTICPGVTVTPLITEISGRNLGGVYEDMLQKDLGGMSAQEPEHVAKELVKLIQSCPNGTVWVIEDGKPRYEYVFPERETMLK
ncbi:hypothetical protein NQ315_001995 [Exocentrus adspersus]|uniref:Alcohol dehydrogenase n=1 Tax=Exocentrus adspersus TaxID=1586481 RepID=A0AAV8WB15_9CUCU|nr:hypothetical protein NQ315_001995 [Exocentrus adspersus]